MLRGWPLIICVLIRANKFNEDLFFKFFNIKDSPGEECRSFWCKENFEERRQAWMDWDNVVLGWLAPSTIIKQRRRRWVVKGCRGQNEPIYKLPRVTSGLTKHLLLLFLHFTPCCLFSTMVHVLLHVGFWDEASFEYELH